MDVDVITWIQDPLAKSSFVRGTCSESPVVVARNISISCMRIAGTSKLTETDCSVPSPTAAVPFVERVRPGCMVLP